MVKGDCARIVTALPGPYGVIVRISRVIVSTAVAVTTAGLVMAVSVRPAAGAASSVSYVALGDSYSSGLGAGAYISSSGSCDRSTNAYPEQWDTPGLKEELQRVLDEGAGPPAVSLRRLEAAAADRQDVHAVEA